MAAASRSVREQHDRARVPGQRQVPVQRGGIRGDPYRANRSAHLRARTHGPQPPHEGEGCRTVAGASLAARRSRSRTSSSVVCEKSSYQRPTARKGSGGVAQTISSTLGDCRSVSGCHGTAPRPRGVIFSRPAPPRAWWTGGRRRREDDRGRSRQPAALPAVGASRRVTPAPRSWPRFDHVGGRPAPYHVSSRPDNPPGDGPHGQISWQGRPSLGPGLRRGRVKERASSNRRASLRCKQGR